VGLRTPLVLGVGLLVACGGSAVRRPGAAAVAAPESTVIVPLKFALSPDRSIYAPPTSLAKAPDTSAHGRQPRR